MDYLNITMPSNQPDLGIAGLHLTRDFSSGFAFGAGLYGATKGNYSGLFILGPEIGYQLKLAKHLHLYTTVFAGAGGGHSLTAQLGNGGTIITSAGAMLPFQSFFIGAGYSIVRVSGGHIDSTQWTTKILIPFNFLLSNTAYKKTRLIYAKQHHLNVMPFVLLGLPHRSFHVDGRELTDENGLCGLELSELVHNHWLYFFRGSASFYGGYSGYMDISLGGGV